MPYAGQAVQYRLVTQLVEWQTENLLVGGSNPPESVYFYSPLAKLVKASDFESEITGSNPVGAVDLPY